MSIEVLQRRFNEIGAQLKVIPSPWRDAPRIDVHGSRFEIDVRDSTELEVVDVRPE